MESAINAVVSAGYDADAIRSGLESLPQDLYDQSYAAVFTATPGVRTIITNLDGKIRNPFKLLHTSRHTRALYAKSYFGTGSQFRIAKAGTSRRRDLKQLRWLKDLTGEHRTLPEKILVL